MKSPVFVNAVAPIVALVVSTTSIAAGQSPGVDFEAVQLAVRDLRETHGAKYGVSVESEALLLETDFVDVADACIDGTLDGLEVKWRGGAAATVVAASGGYPGSYAKGKQISGLEEADALEGVTVFHAGTARAEDGSLITSGGRVLAVTGLGDDLAGALDRAYKGLEKISFEGLHHRTDIGARAL